ncbi:heterokaryon incompatibility protein-domain-containing protein [Diplogelasinospora grovesii]|uniref:Heterokaryon incompatibility protein-domain-containing protein n=1 Tax=Diplogelasinospora grovesii TaxID=303347 RepID=A0AAN6N013_9PEZI|nr:heterokaryon incompatibility protein-domain-containing protein [Diplogelasinospora grovesii]
MSPMRLCDLCSSLNMTTLAAHIHLGYLTSQTARYRSPHHHRFSSLKKSAVSCDMCALFLNAVTEHLCRILEKRDPPGSGTLLELASYMFSLAEAHADEGPQCYIKTQGKRFGITAILYHARYASEGEESVGLFAVRNYTDETRVAFTEVGSLPDWSLARKWIEKCKATHENCSVDVISSHEKYDIGPSEAQPQLKDILPSRLIDVGDNINEPRLFEDITPTTAYATLSHCWGRSRPLQTTTSNIGQHRLSIPLANMPLTFQHAVITARELGIKYLWIDSLCIIQGSSSDWEVECAKMASIFRRSVVTIYGPAATDSDSGFIHPRTPPYVAHLWEYRNPGEDKPKRATLIHLRTDSHLNSDYPSLYDTLTEKEKVSPIQRRGWILQEQILSPRNLYIGSYRMYFECTDTVTFEDIRHDVKGFPGALHGHRATNSMRREIKTSLYGRASLRQLWPMWCQLVQDYSQRALTEPSDKFPAISGIADCLLGGHSADYLAGLLRSSIRETLSWYVHLPKRELQRVIGYRAPTWSWASTDQSVSFVWEPYERSEEAGGVPMSGNGGIQIHDASVTVNGDNPYGKVAAASIKLTSVVRDSTVVICVPGGKEMPLDLIIRHPDIPQPAMFYPDEPQRWGLFIDDDDEADRYEDGVELGVIKYFLLGYSSTGDTCTAIAIEPCGSVQAASRYKPYRRIGLVIFVGWGPENYTRHWFHGCPSEEIELF